MKRQSAKIQQIKGKIASLTNLCKLGVKKYIVTLLDLESELANLLSLFLGERQSTKMQFNLGERVIRKKENSYGRICIGTIVSICGDRAEVQWDGKYSNIKKQQQIKDLLPISEKEAYIQKLRAKSKNKLRKSLQVIMRFYESQKDDEGWWSYDDFMICLSSNKITGIGLEELNRYCASKEKRSNDAIAKDHPGTNRGYILAVKLASPCIPVD